MPIEKTDKIWMRRRRVNWDDAKIHVLTHTLPLRLRRLRGHPRLPDLAWPRVFRLTDHVRRLHDSALLLHMELPYSVEELVEATKETIRANRLDSATSAPSCSSGTGRWASTRCPAP